jgi:hypothetical protein
MKLGVAWRTDPRLSHALHFADAAVVAICMVGVVWFVWHQLRKRRS